MISKTGDPKTRHVQQGGRKEMYNTLHCVDHLRRSMVVVMASMPVLRSLWRFLSTRSMIMTICDVVVEWLTDDGNDDCDETAGFDSFHVLLSAQARHCLKQGRLEKTPSHPCLGSWNTGNSYDPFCHSDCTRFWTFALPSPPPSWNSPAPWCTLSSSSRTSSPLPRSACVSQKSFPTKSKSSCSPSLRKPNCWGCSEENPLRWRTQQMIVGSVCFVCKCVFQRGGSVRGVIVGNRGLACVFKLVMLN